jgi:hypothetical protein
MLTPRRVVEEEDEEEDGEERVDGIRTSDRGRGGAAKASTATEVDDDDDDDDERARAAAAIAASRGWRFAGALTAASIVRTDSNATLSLAMPPVFRDLRGRCAESGGCGSKGEDSDDCQPVMCVCWRWQAAREEDRMEESNF